MSPYWNKQAVEEEHKWWRRDKSPKQRDLCRYPATLPSRKENLTLTPKCGLCTVTSFQRAYYKRGRKSNFTMEKPNKHHCMQVQGQHHGWYAMGIACTLDIMWWQWQFASVVFLSGTQNPSLIMRKTQDKPQLRTFCKRSGQYSNLQRSLKTRRVGCLGGTVG